MSSPPEVVVYPEAPTSQVELTEIVDLPTLQRYMIAQSADADIASDKLALVTRYASVARACGGRVGVVYTEHASGIGRLRAALSDAARAALPRATRAAPSSC